MPSNDVRQYAPDPSGLDLADMHLHLGKRRRFHTVSQDIARIRESGRVHYNPISPCLRRFVDAVNRLAFDIGVKDPKRVSVIVSMGTQPLVKF